VFSLGWPEGSGWRHEAAASGLTIDALRHYDEIGVLKPASVDPRTSYRRYGGDQLSDARLICHLRGVDLPVDEVRAVLHAGSPALAEEILQRHRQRLARRAEALPFVLGAWQTDSFFLLTVENWIDGATPSACGLLVDDVDLRHARALKHGATDVMPRTDYDFKPRSAVVDDPSGNRIQLSQG
jgi:DNA-binding transcriptional MerR regulator